MEIIRVIPIVVFVLFCGQIAFRKVQLQKNGVAVSTFKVTPKSVFATVGLVAFFVIYISELLFQSLQITVAVLPRFFQIHAVQSGTLSALGILLLILSMVSMCFTLVALKNSLRFGLDSANLGKLITTGIFCHSRNPFFISILLLLLGISLVFPIPFFVGIFILSLISIHLTILREENFMRENYGEEYREYSQKVRRYF